MAKEFNKSICWTKSQDMTVFRQGLKYMTGLKYTAGDPQVTILFPSIKLKDFDLDTNTRYSHMISKTQFSEQEK